jgi:hypothetical protein
MWHGFYRTSAAAATGTPDSLQGVTLSRPERAYTFEDRDEAEQTAARLNGTLIHGGEAVFNDGWAVVEV